MVISYDLPWEECVYYDPGKNRIQRNQSWTTGKLKEVERAEYFHVWQKCRSEALPLLLFQLYSQQKLMLSWCPFLLNLEMAESTEAATGAGTQIFSPYLLFPSVSWALCHAWMDQALRCLWSDNGEGLLLQEKTLLLAQGEDLLSTGRWSGSELNTREKDWYKALGKEPNTWRETYAFYLRSEILILVVDCSRHFKII